MKELRNTGIRSLRVEGDLPRARTAPTCSVAVGGWAEIVRRHGDRQGSPSCGGRRGWRARPKLSPVSPLRSAPCSTGVTGGRAQGRASGKVCLRTNVILLPTRRTRSASLCRWATAGWSTGARQPTLQGRHGPGHHSGVGPRREPAGWAGTSTHRDPRPGETPELPGDPSSTLLTPPCLIQ